MERRFHLKWRITDEDAGKTVREFLQKQKVSRMSLKAIIHEGGAMHLNEKPVTVQDILTTGDELVVIFPEEKPSAKLVPEPLDLSIIYEDQAFLVVNKPAGLATMPSPDHPTGTLANGLVHYYAGRSIAAAIHIVTRLDVNTSGLVLIARNRHIHHLFNLQQQEGLLQKEYLALAEGVFSEKRGTIEAPIGRKKGSIIERTITPEGQYACTLYEVVEQFADFALVRLRLLTGRTHQIRVHLAHIGHPLLGDDMYGGNKSYLPRQALHCYKLMFPHPLTGEKRSITAPLPEDMQAIVTEYRAKS